MPHPAVIHDKGQVAVWQRAKCIDSAEGLQRARAVARNLRSTECVTVDLCSAEVLTAVNTSMVSGKYMKAMLSMGLPCTNVGSM